MLHLADHKFVDDADGWYRLQYLMLIATVKYRQ